jgi:hypothetical protein
MRALVRGFHYSPAIVALLVSAACSGERGALTQAAGTNRAPVTMNVTSAAPTPSLAGTMTGLMTGAFDGDRGFGDFGDGMGHRWRGWWGWMRTRDVDSLIVTVTKVEVLAALPDSEDAADSLADSVKADSGKGRGDDDADNREQREFGWIQLPVSGGGHLDLVNLPDSGGTGIMVASGTLPAGRYRHVRLFVTNPLIYFDSLIVTPAGDSLQAGVGYPVIFPSADSTGATIKTDDPFIVPAVGDTVQVTFDRDDTVRHIIITGDGKIIVPPVFRFHFGRRDGR